MQVPVDQGFLATLEASRRQAILKGKGKPKMPKFPRRKWEYPILQERKYVKKSDFTGRIEQGRPRFPKGAPYPCLLQGRSEGYNVLHVCPLRFALTYAKYAAVGHSK